LERVVDSTEYFHDVQAIQTRFANLTGTRDEITAAQVWTAGWCREGLTPHGQLARDSEEQELKLALKRLEMVPRPRPASPRV
jgi:hypothetical protein